MELLEVVLEPAAPVGRGDRLGFGEDLEDLLDLGLADHRAEADLLGGVHGHREREVAVHDTEDEVLALLAEELLVLQVFDHGRPVLGMDDGVSLAERGQVVPLRKRARKPDVRPARMEG